jgi:hypothetical protein
MSNPVGVGHLLDRAVAGYVRAFLPIVAILAVEVIPSAILASVLGSSTPFASGFAQLGRTSPDPAANAATFERMQHAFAGLMVVALAGSALALFARSATVIYIDAVADERPLTIGASLRRALPRWFPQVGLAAIVFVLFVFVTLAVVIVLGVLAVIASLAARGMNVPAAVSGSLGVIAFIVAGVLVLVLTLAGLLAYELAMVAVALAEEHPWRAFTRGVRAVLDARVWRSTLAVGASLFALSLLGSVLSIAIGGAAFAITQVAALQIVLQSAVAVLLGGLVQWFIVLYARAVRERRTGAELIRLAETAPA